MTVFTPAGLSAWPSFRFLVFLYASAWPPFWKVFPHPSFSAILPCNLSTVSPWPSVWPPPRLWTSILKPPLRLDRTLFLSLYGHLPDVPSGLCCSEAYSRVSQPWIQCSSRQLPSPSVGKHKYLHPRQCSICPGPGLALVCHQADSFDILFALPLPSCAQAGLRLLPRLAWQLFSLRKLFPWLRSCIY